MRRALVTLVTLVSLIACKSKPTPEPAASAPDAGPPPIVSARPALDAGAAIASDDDAKKFVAYTSALGRGRTATIAKRYPDAFKAFDEALAIRPNDARALAEKGYAELLAGKLDDAADDLGSASTTTDRDLGAQVWFNLGLVDEARKHPDRALVAFWFSDKLHSSGATQKRLAGRTVCPVTVDSAHTAAKRAADWRDVAKTIREGLPETCRTVPSAEADAKAALVMGAAVTVPGKGDFFLVRNAKLEDCFISELFVVQVSGKDMWLYPAVGSGVSVGSRIDQEDDVSIERLGAWIHVAQISAPVTQVYTCEHADAGRPRIYDCDGTPGERMVGVAHPQAPPTYVDHILDADAHARVLRLEDAASSRFAEAVDGGRVTRLRLDSDALSLDGFGCKLRFSRGDGGL